MMDFVGKVGICPIRSASYRVSNPENKGEEMEERKGPSKAEILKMAIDGLSPKDKEEFNKLIASTMEKRPVNNKIELQRG